jgi:hypothetical protein
VAGGRNFIQDIRIDLIVIVLLHGCNIQPYQGRSTSMAKFGIMAAQPRVRSGARTNGVVIVIFGQKLTQTRVSSGVLQELMIHTSVDIASLGSPVPYHSSGFGSSWAWFGRKLLGCLAGLWDRTPLR